MKRFLVFVIFFISTFDLFGEEYEEFSLLDGWRLHGLANIIPYLDGRDFEHDTYMRYSTTMKLQLGVEKAVTDDISFLLKFQDSRLWGEEGSFTNFTDNVDLIAGWVRFDNIFDIPLSLLLGRYQMELGTGRIIRHSPWSYEERAFDGVQANYSFLGHSLMAFYAVHRDGIGYYREAAPGRYDYPDERYDGSNMFGLWTKWGISGGQADLFVYHEKDNKKSDSLHIDLDRTTLGGDWIGKIFAFDVKAELYGQFGSIGAKDLSAYMAGLEMNYSLEKNFNLTAGTNIYSGTSPEDMDEKNNSFSPTLGAKHRFLGLMDYFRKIEAGSSSLGVNDFYAGATYGGRSEGDFQSTFRWHYFLSNQESAGGLSDFGNECDVTVKYFPVKAVSVEWTNGFFIPGELYLEMYKTEKESGGFHYRNDVAFMSYVRLILSI